MVREQVEMEAIEDALKVFHEYLMKRINKHGMGKFASSHEAYGVLAEEVDESLDELRLNDKDKFVQEMLDVAVTGIWAYVSLKEKK